MGDEPGRLLGVDYGAKRIGLALSDPTRTLASPYATLTRRSGKRPPWTDLKRVVEEQEVSEIVVGLPLSLAGDEGDWCAEVREFGRKLGERTDRPIHFQDERMTSVLAESAIRQIGLPKSKRESKERIDAAAAAILLQNYIDG